MDDSLIYIIIAALLFFFQVFTDKKKREAKRQAALKKNEPFDFISDLLNEDGKDEKVEKPERIVEKFKYNPVESGMSEESVENPSEPVQKSMVQTSGMPREGIAFIPDKEFMLPETTVGDETLHHSIDPRLLILYSEIMKPKFTE